MDFWELEVPFCFVNNKLPFVLASQPQAISRSAARPRSHGRARQTARDHSSHTSRCLLSRGMFVWRSFKSREGKKGDALHQAVSLIFCVLGWNSHQRTDRLTFRCAREVYILFFKTLLLGSPAKGQSNLFPQDLNLKRTHTHSASEAVG